MFSHSLAGFVAATMVLLVIPGPAVLYIVTRSATQGTAAGLVSVLGIHAGTVVHLAGAMVGLSAVLTTSALAFQAVKLAGALYLLWLGVAALGRYRRSKPSTVADGPGALAVNQEVAGSGQPGASGSSLDGWGSGGSGVQAQSMRAIFKNGAVVNLLNPKTAVFFVSIVPQFIDPSGASPTAQLLFLGIVFMALGMVSDGVYAVAGGLFGRRIASSSGSSARFERRRELVSGISYMGIGAATAVSGAP